MFTDLKDEVIDGHLVSASMKKVWKIELDILDQFERICNKYSLKWYAMGGTLLGAVRHKGFIPWDDDLDVTMPADDFDRFCEVASDELEDPYFFQFYTTENHGSFYNATIRRSDTTGIKEYEKDLPPAYNKGIFIDIFPLYRIPDNKLKYQFVTRTLSFFQHILVAKHLEEAIKDHRLRKNRLKLLASRILTALPWKYNTLCDHYYRKCRKAGKNGQKKVGLLSFHPGDRRWEWNKEVFDETVSLPFENRTIQAPQGWDEYLKTTYGEYMKPVKGGTLHGQVIFDTERSWLEVQKEFGKL